MLDDVDLEEELVLASGVDFEDLDEELDFVGVFFLVEEPETDDLRAEDREDFEDVDLEEEDFFGVEDFLEETLEFFGFEAVGEVAVSA